MLGEVFITVISFLQGIQWLVGNGNHVWRENWLLTTPSKPAIGTRVMFTFVEAFQDF